MIKLTIVAAALLVSTPVWAGTIENTFANTVVSTDAKGNTSTWQFNADGKYTVKLADGQTGSGVWKIVGSNICSTPDVPAGQPAAAQICVAYVDGKNVGDSWTTSDGNGGTYNLSIKAGR